MIASAKRTGSSRYSPTKPVKTGSARRHAATGRKTSGLRALRESRVNAARRTLLPITASTSAWSYPPTILQIVLLLLAFQACSCASRYPRENKSDPLKDAPALSEPDSYSATIVQTIEDGNNREIIETRIAHSGEMFRDEWREGGESRAAIWRPDLGKMFLLSIDRRLFVETTGNPETDAAPIEPGANLSSYLVTGGEPETLNVERLPDSTVQGHVCTAIERLATFADGHRELTLIYSANDLGGLMLRMESSVVGSDTPRRTLVERKNVRTDVSNDEFIVPSSYRKVNSL